MRNNVFFYTQKMTPTRLDLAYQSLQGLAIGDTFGENFWGKEDEILQHIQNRHIPIEHNHWGFTDDTVMGIAVYRTLERYGEIEQTILAQYFAENYQKDIRRGYGGTAHYILREIGDKRAWREVSQEVFDGQGSMGNGGAMRAAPIGAFFYDNPAQIIAQTHLATEVTHANHEAQVGAVAIALAAGLVVEARLAGKAIGGEMFLDAIYQQLEDSDTKAKVGKALSLSATYRIETVTNILGNGKQLLAQDTVPFALWCVAHHLQNFEEALWVAVAGLGDRDTICAMVGSIAILYAPDTVPAAWVASVEAIQTSVFW